MEPKVVGNQKLGEYLEKAYGKQLADEEVVEYKDRLVKFFSLIIEIDQKRKSKEVVSNEK